MNRTPQHHITIVYFLCVSLTLPFTASTVLSQDAPAKEPKKEDAKEPKQSAQESAQTKPEKNPAAADVPADKKPEPADAPADKKPEPADAPADKKPEPADASTTPPPSTEPTADDAAVTTAESVPEDAPAKEAKKGADASGAVSTPSTPSTKEQNAPTKRSLNLPRIVPAPQPPPPLPLIPTGSFFSRYELREGQDKITVPSSRIEEMSAVAYRARFGLATTPMKVTDCLNAQVRFTPQASGFWRAGGLNDAELGLHEGALRLQSCHVWLDIGRTELAYGDHLVISNVEWNETGRSFDGVRLRIGTDPKQAWVDLLALIIAEGPAESAPIDSSADKYFTGVYAGIGPLVGDKTDFDFYALVHIHPETEIPLEELEPGQASIVEAAADLTLGSRLKLRVAMLDFRLEGGLQVGSRRASQSLGGAATDVLAFQFDGEVGGNLLEDTLRIALGGLYASGDDPDTRDKIEAWDQLYPTVHKWLGASDIIGGRSNVGGPLLRLSYRTPWKIRFTLEGHMFFRPQETETVAESGLAANEIDAGVIYSVGEGLKLRTLYALFLPVSDLYQSDDPVHFYELELRYEF